MLSSSVAHTCSLKAATILLPLSVNTEPTFSSGISQSCNIVFASSETRSAVCGEGILFTVIVTQWCLWSLRLKKWAVWPKNDAYTPAWSSVPHEESRKMFFFVHFASFLQNQLSYGHVLCTIIILYLPWFHRVLGMACCHVMVTWHKKPVYIPQCSRQLLVEFLHNRCELRPDNAAFKPLPRVPSVTCV